MHSEDAQLVQRCLEGDTDAFGRLVESYQGAVFATAYYYAGRYGAAEDITQDAFLEAYRSLRSLRDPNRFGPWLKELACRTSANWLRKHGKRLQNETPLPYRRTISIEDARQGPEQLTERKEQVERINRAIDALPERYRLPVVLRYLQELSYEEISEFTGETKDEVRGVLERASRLMRDILENKQSEDESSWRRVRE